MPHISSQKRGIVASGHPLVSQTAIDIMGEGGNAFDAAVAAGFVSSLAEPALTSLGGGGFLLAHSGNTSILFDFFSDTPGKGLPLSSIEPHFFPIIVQFPSSKQIFNIGHGSVAVPANLKGLLHVHRRLGSIPLDKVLTPAIRHARQGVEINQRQAYFLDILKPIITLTRKSRKLYQQDGKYLQAGSIFKNEELANFLEKLSNGGDDDFYGGVIAEKISEEMARESGLLTREDLYSYQVIERQPLSLDYHDRTLLTNPPPSFGGPLIAAALELLKPSRLMECSWGGQEHLLAIAEAMRLIERRRQSSVFSFDEATLEWCQAHGEAVRRFSRGTTHISIIDRQGNVASMTTSNGEGSGYIAPDTGIMLNNMMGEDDLHPSGFHSTPPGQRICSMMAPTILLRDGEPELVTGSGGSKRIRTAIMQVLINFIDFDMDIERAVLSPRMHWDGEVLQVEPGFQPKILEKLRQKIPINIWPEKNMYFGGAHSIGKYRGVGDPRRGGDSRTADPVL